ncbi:MAG: bifunctional DNA primase/polymerase [bacterium]|nr:bifunctional DNA primase/polymerase [bacterium]
MEIENLKDAALKYLNYGFSIIPVGIDKKPLIEWKRFQTVRATPEQIKGWFDLNPDMNIGTTTGAISGVVVIDIEKDGSTKGFPPTVTSRTGGGGYHLFYKHPGVPVRNSVKEIAPLTDVRGDGGYVVLPPSAHTSGNKYEWIISPEEGEFAELPEHILVKLKDLGKKTDWTEFSTADVVEGERNNAAAQFIGKLLHDLSTDLWETAGWHSLKSWNQKCCKPPLEEKELRAIFESILQRESTQREKKEEKADNGSQAGQLVNFVFQDHNITLFHDQFDIPYAKFVTGKHKEIRPIGGSIFKHWLAKSFYDSHKKTLSQNTLTTALLTIGGRASFGGEEIKLHTRTAMIDSAIWYDLANKDWRVVKITPDGWSVIDNPPIIFKRQQHQAAQVDPATGGNIPDILQFVNISDENQQLLFLVLLVSYFIPGFPHPIPYVYGPQGSAKSTLSKIVRKLVDPSRLGVLSLPRKEEELVQVLSHHYMLFFDNVGTIPDSVSDLLCRAVTGSGFSKRQLYTDDEDIICNIQANIGINGINLASNKPDLLERSVLFELPRVEKIDRQQEHKLWEKFEREQSKLLGAIFDTIAKAIVLKATIKASSLPRMADFALWGCAIAEAMGFRKEEFLNAYDNNINSQNAEVLGEHVEAELLCTFMGDREEWNGTSSQLLEFLRDTATTLQIAQSDLPKSAGALSRKLNTLKINLEEVGIKVIKSKGTRRTLSIRKNPVNIADTDNIDKSIVTNRLNKDDMPGDEQFKHLPEASSITFEETVPKDDKDDTGGIFHAFGHNTNAPDSDAQVKGAIVAGTTPIDVSPAEEHSF